MAKRARAKPTANTVDPELVNQLLDKLDEIQERQLSDLGSYRAKCKEHKKSADGIFKEAKARGIPPKLLKMDIKIRQKKREIAEIRDSVEPDYEADFDAICAATATRDGGKPTEVAQQKASVAAKTSAALDSFESRH